jgi:transketolase
MSPTPSELREIAKVVRRDVLTMVLEAGSGHVGGSLSCVDILVALYWQVLRIKPDRPTWEDRDRFVLSKAHAAPALYAALARRGYFDVRDLLTFRKLKSKLQGTPDPHRTAGVDVSVGSQGEGLSIANGIALSARRASRGFRVYCLLGDGEVQEGQVWEAALTAAHYKLDSVCAIIDRNGLMGAGPTDEIAALTSLADKWRAFDWNVSEVDGHNVEQLASALTEAGSVKGKPSVIVANTVKGKGVPFMEGKVEWHDRKLTVDVYEEAMKALT